MGKTGHALEHGVITYSEVADFLENLPPNLESKQATLETDPRNRERSVDITGL